MRNKNPKYRINGHNFLKETLVFARGDRKDALYNWWMAMQDSWATLLHRSRGFKGHMQGQSRFDRTFTPLGKRRFY